MRHGFITAAAVMLGLLAWGWLSDAYAASRSHHRTYVERTGSYWQHYGYPRPNCTFAIREYQRRWPYQLWPPSMRCFRYPN
jgi:hypothetical protein